MHTTKHSYNDIASWNHEEIVTGLGGNKFPVKFFKIKNREELKDLLLDEEFNTSQGFQFVELHMAKTDSPEVFRKLCGKANP